VCVFVQVEPQRAPHDRLYRGERGLRGLIHEGVLISRDYGQERNQGQEQVRDEYSKYYSTAVFSHIREILYIESQGVCF
jgi:hypothetical protein